MDFFHFQQAGHIVVVEGGAAAFGIGVSTFTLGDHDGLGQATKAAAGAAAVLAVVARVLIVVGGFGLLQPVVVTGLAVILLLGNGVGVAPVVVGGLGGQGVQWAGVVGHTLGLSRVEAIGLLNAFDQVSFCGDTRY